MDRGRNICLNRRRTHAAALLALGTFMLAGCGSVAGALLAPRIDPAAATLEAGDFQLDTTHAALLFRINHLGYADYVGRFDRFDASLSGDPARPEGASVDAIIDMTSLNIANPEFGEELMGPSWFDAGNHPQAIFRSRSVRLTGPVTAEIKGDLTLRGVTRPLSLSARFNGSAFDPLRRADVAGFSATAEFSRADFGIDRFSGLITDTVRIEVEAEFIRNGRG